MLRSVGHVLQSQNASRKAHRELSKAANSNTVQRPVL